MRLNELWNRILYGHAGITELQFLNAEINSWLQSKRRRNMITAREYYLGEQDIRNKKRLVYDENGKANELNNAPNNIILDNKVDDLVDQKANYLLAKPIDVQCDAELDYIFNNRFNRQLKNVGRDAIIGGVGYLIPYIDKEGNFKLKKALSEHILPFWADDEHTILDAFIYMYPIEVYEAGSIKTIIHKVEYYTCLLYTSPSPRDS